MNIYYRNLNPNDGVTGSCHFLTIKNHKYEKELNIMLDFGQVQDSSMSFDQLYKINGRELPIDWSTIDYIIISHAHADHVQLLSRVPSFYDFKGKILMIELTAKLGAINLADGCHLHNKEIERINKNKKGNKYVPYMTSKSTEQAITMMQGYSFNQEISLNGSTVLTFLPSGHIPGASMPLITIKEDYNVERILFTGDTSAEKDIPFTMKPNLKDMKISHIITESTYNNRLIPKNNSEEELIKYINETCIEKKGKIAIPVFSIARSTAMLYHLRNVYKNNPQFSKVKIYFASPMAYKAHKEICNENNLEFYDEKWHKEIDLFKWEQVEYITDFKQVQRVVEEKEPAIYLSASGMANGGYIKYIISKLITRKNNRLMFCGYQSKGTTGELLVSGVQKNITIEDENERKKSVPIKAAVNMINGMSSHADYKDIINMFKKIEKKKLNNILLVHGDSDGMEFFKSEIQKEFKNVNIKIPKYNEIIKLC